MQTALVMAQRATCPRASVGGVIAVRNRIVATGYNGSPCGTAHCHDVGCLMHEGHCIRTIHAEANALINATISVRGGTIYVTHYPCPICANLIVQSGIAQVYYLNKYRDTRIAESIFSASMVRIEQFSEKIRLFA